MSTIKMELDTMNLSALGAAFALTLHQLYTRYEPRGIAWQCLGWLLLSSVGVPTWCIKEHNQSLIAALRSSSIFHAAAFVSLMASLAFYRLFLHPLRNFPGPTLAALTKIKVAALVAEGYTPDWIEEQHDKYGDIVRIGPNELSIRSADVVPQILGSQLKLDKGPWYSAGFAERGSSIHVIQDFHKHAARRKFWDRAFSGKALADYTPLVIETGDKFIEQVRRDAAKGDIDLGKWSHYVAFEIMSVLGFGGGGFGLLEGKDEEHFYLRTVANAMKAVSTFAEIPWIMPILTKLPAEKDITDLETFSMNTTVARKKRGTVDRRDIFSYITGEDEKEPSSHTIHELEADVRVVVVAGSDTTASSLTFAFYHLLQRPEWMKRLYDEVAPFRGVTLSNDQLATLPVLNAVINETLRLVPPVPFRSQREVPAGGMELAKKFVPAGTVVSVPFRAVLHDPRYFDNPKEWRPERFLDSDKESVFERKAFIPFSQGTYSCVGKPFALLEMRFYITMFVLNFDGKLAPGFDKKAFERSVKDRFTIQNGPMMVSLTQRK